MSKLDQLRRQREEQHARQEQQTGAPAPAGRARDAPAPSPVLAARRTKAAVAAPEGACSVCGKVKALNNGLVSSHQKGLGKPCPGSRKEPA
jgi:hypothetical protein